MLNKGIKHGDLQRIETAIILLHGFAKRCKQFVKQRDAN